MCSIVLLSIFRYGLTTAQLGVEYYSSKKGWMTTAVFNAWITNWNHNLRWMEGNRKVVPFVDQASSHVLQDLCNIMDPVSATQYDFQIAVYGSRGDQIT